MDEKSSSDDENDNYDNYDNVMFAPDDDEVPNLALPGEFIFHRFDENVNDLAQSSNDSESCSSHSNDNSSDESDEYYNHSDCEEKFSSGSNKFVASNAESADTTHSYSNSLLEDEEDDNGGGAATDNSDFEADEQYEDAHLHLPNAKIDKVPNFSDFNNGTFRRWSFWNFQKYEKKESRYQYTIYLVIHVVLILDEMWIYIFSSVRIYFIHINFIFLIIGNYQPTSCSDSESPTEPLTQKVIPIQ